jgi:hypothetical protein
MVHENFPSWLNDSEKGALHSNMDVHFMSYGKRPCLLRSPLNVLNQAIRVCSGLISS